MAGFREYKIGSRLFGIALGGSMTITLFFPSINIASVSSTDIALTKQLAIGHETGFNLDDPLMLGKNKPLGVSLKVDPKTGQPIDGRNAGVCLRTGNVLPGRYFASDGFWVKASRS